MRIGGLRQPAERKVRQRLRELGQQSHQLLHHGRQQVVGRAAELAAHPRRRVGANVDHVQELIECRCMRE